MEDRKFDDFTKLLAAPGFSRRQLLQRALAGIAGAVAGSLLPGRAWADIGGGNSDCAHFCSALFGDLDDLTGICVSAAAHGGGLCYECGPSAPAGHGPLCAVGTAEAFCCKSGETCCGNTHCADLQTDVLNCGSCGNTCISGAVCQSGQCVCPAGTVECNGACVSNVCAPGQVFNASTCMCEAASHPECVGAQCGTFKPCASSNQDCVCVTTAEGGGVCIPGSTQCAPLQPCATSADCGAGGLCAVNTCCGPGVCIPATLSDMCPATGVASVQAAFLPQVSAGPTIASR